MLEQPGPQLHPVGWRDLTFEDRKLHALAVILAGLGDMPKPAAARGIGRVYIVADDHQHCSAP